MTSEQIKEAIDLSHPEGDPVSPSLSISADSLARALVHERHSKRDLVDLVRWLILRNPEGLLKRHAIDVQDSHGSAPYFYEIIDRGSFDHLVSSGGPFESAEEALKIGRESLTAHLTAEAAQDVLRK